MASLTAEQKATLAQVARDEGVELEALEQAALEVLDEQPEEEGESKPEQSGALKADRLLIGHFPYMRVNEIRAALGLPTIPDGELMSGDWLLKHGGGAAGAQEPEATPPDEL